MTVALMCLQVFLCRVLDVSLGTLRTILTVRGKNLLAAGIGFIEVAIWFLVVRSALNSDEGGLLIALSYAAGFASGTFLGGIIAKRYFRSFLNLQVVTSSQNNAVVDAVRAAGFAVSVLNVNGSEFGSEKYLLVIEIKSENLKKLEKIIYSHDPSAFIMARDTKYIQNGFIK